MRDDPCFSCVLPDCDDKHPDCLVLRLKRRYQYKMSKKQVDEITDLEREARRISNETWQIERRAEASEGGRVYRHGTVVYGRQDSAAAG